MAGDTNILCWQEELLKRVGEGIRTDDYWRGRFTQQDETNLPPFTVHLAVFVEPYLRYIFDGTKTIESRFSRKPCPPYKRVSVGDAILLKRSGGPVTGICQVGTVSNYQLDSASWDEVKQFAPLLCASSPTFWEERAGASFATLIRIEHVSKMEPIPCGKRDRRGWVVVKSRSEQLELQETQS